MKRWISIAACMLPFMLAAQSYNVDLVPDSLKKDADAIKRFEELRVVIKGINKAVIKHKYAITVLNEAGDSYAQYENSYSKLQSLSDIDGNLYDASGKRLKNVKKKDIADVSYDDQMSLMTDDRLKRHNFYYRSYPYTIEYEDEQEFDGIFFLPYWQPQDDERFSVEQSRLVVEMPNEYELRFKQFNYDGQPNKNSQKTTTYTWEVKNMKAIESESFQPAWREVTTSVFLAPAQFQIGGYTGDMRTWQDLGKFITSLNKGRDQLPENVKQDIHKLTDNISDIHEKVRLLYEYLQKNTRYISIQLGIGSWQPFEAKVVATKRYGDCKALSNYMVSILKEAGVPSNYVLISAGAGRKGLWEDFPAPYFNHAIMCVPTPKDTIWLECTSQTESAGYMGSFTGNRKALLIAYDGGHVVKTPGYSMNDNLQVRKISAKVDEAGNLEADVHTKFVGIQQELQHILIHEATKEQREKYFNRTLNLPTYKVDKIDYKEEKKSIPVIDEDIHVTSLNYAATTGKRLFIKPNLFNRQDIKLNTDKERKFDIQFNYSFSDIDSIEVSIPEGFAVESVPKDVSFNNKFGAYSIEFKIDNNKIFVVRTNSRNEGLFPASEYKLLAKYFDDIHKADFSQIVFVKKDN